MRLLRQGLLRSETLEAYILWLENTDSNPLKAINSRGKAFSGGDTLTRIPGPDSQWAGPERNNGCRVDHGPSPLSEHYHF